MAATYTQVTLQDMDTFLKRAFRSLRPERGSQRGEITYDLFLSPTTVIRVFTSIGESRDSGAQVGEDAIRILLYSLKKGRPLKPGKAPIVKRTQNWRDSLKDRIEDYLEAYSDHEEAIEAGAFINW